MIALLLHLRRSILLVVAPALAIAGGSLVWTSSYPQIATQANIADGVGSAIAVLAPVLAGFSAWDALRERRNGGGPILDVAARPSSRDLLARLGVAEIAAAFIFLALVATSYARAARFALSGPPLWVNLLVPLLVLGLSAAIGALAAGLLKHWSAVIVAAFAPAAVYASSVFGPHSGLAWSLNPFGSGAGGDFLVPNPPFFLGQAAVLMGLLLLVVSVALMLSRQDFFKGAVVASCAIAVVVGGAMTVNAQNDRWGLPLPNLASKLVEAETDDGGLTLAFLPEYRPVQDELLARWSRVQSILAGTPAAFDRLEQLTNSHPEASVRPVALTALYLNYTSPTVATVSVLESLIDLHTSACQTSGTYETLLVEYWLAGPGVEQGEQMLPEHVEALARLRALDDEEARTWMSGAFDRFASCEITLADLPQAR